MKKLLILVFLWTLHSCTSQENYDSSIEFTSDLKQFSNLSLLKEKLRDVEIISLGENTHGLGNVFTAKTELVKFLHQELGFNMVLFESGFGDATLAWEQLDSLSTKDYVRSFSSNFYYQSEEIKTLMQYVKTQNKKLVIQGFDCQPQQNYLIRRMTEIMQPVDTAFAKTVPVEMHSFNKLYQYENTKDSLNFYKQRDAFIGFLTTYNNQLDTYKHLLSASKKEIEGIKRSIQIFKETYSEIAFGGVMSWPLSDNIRDLALFRNIQWFKEQHPKAKIIIWAQNSHIENKPKPNYTVQWMGHLLKKTYGDQYYSVGTIVYRGKNLNYNGSFDFEHSNPDYLAYHLHQLQKEQFFLDLRAYEKKDFITQPLLGMENNGNTAKFVAKERFDGLLFLEHSDIPKLLKKE